VIRTEAKLLALKAQPDFKGLNALKTRRAWRKISCEK